MVIAGVQMSNPFTPSMLYAHMNAAQSPVKDIRFRTLGDNIHDLVLLLCVLEEGDRGRSMALSK